MRIFIIPLHTSYRLRPYQPVRLSTNIAQNLYVAPSVSKGTRVSAKKAVGTELVGSLVVCALSQQSQPTRN